MSQKSSLVVQLLVVPCFYQRCFEPQGNGTWLGLSHTPHFVVVSQIGLGDVQDSIYIQVIFQGPPYRIRAQSPQAQTLHAHGPCWNYMHGIRVQMISISKGPYWGLQIKLQIQIGIQIQTAWDNHISYTRLICALQMLVTIVINLSIFKLAISCGILGRHTWCLWQLGWFICFHSMECLVFGMMYLVLLPFQKYEDLHLYSMDILCSEQSLLLSLWT